MLMKARSETNSLHTKLKIKTGILEIFMIVKVIQHMTEGAHQCNRRVPWGFHRQWRLEFLIFFFISKVFFKKDITSVFTKTKMYTPQQHKKNKSSKMFTPNYLHFF